MLQAIPPTAQAVPAAANTSHDSATVAGAVAVEAVAASPVVEPGKGARTEDKKGSEDHRQGHPRREPPAGKEEPHLLDLFA